LQTADGRTIQLPYPGEEEGMMEGEGGGSPGDHLRRMLEEARAFLQNATSEQDRLIIEKVTTLVQQLLATSEKDADAAMGISGNLRSMQRGRY
jgi:hypothetical protein